MKEAKIELPEPGILSGLLSTIFPVRCVHCGREGNWLCRNCAGALKAVGPPACRHCGSPALRGAGTIAGFSDDCGECRGRQLNFRQARSIFPHEGPARSLVHRLKYSGQRRLAHFMVTLICTTDTGLTAYLKGATLTYVPLHRSKQLDRGFNQSGLIAEALSRQLGLPFGEFLVKKRPTASQNRLDFSARMTNLSGSFALRQGSMRGGRQTGAREGWLAGRREGHFDGGRLVLIDDVYTTGATVSECAGVLKDGLGVDVDVLTLARSLRRRVELPGF